MTHQNSDNLGNEGRAQMADTTTIETLVPGEADELRAHSTGLGIGLERVYQRAQRALLHSTSVRVAAYDIGYQLGILHMDAVHVLRIWRDEAATAPRNQRDRHLAVAELANRLALEVGRLRARVRAVHEATTGTGSADDRAELSAVADRVVELELWLGHGTSG